jgi:sugar phosphate isomerase/epimerase
MEDKSEDFLSRRNLMSCVAGMSGLSLMAREREDREIQPTPLGKLKICAFSKHFQWTEISETAAIVKELGFDGVDLTVRPGGHVLPERVESDLPKAVESIRGAGLEVPMITTSITGTATPHTEAVLRTASRLGIRHYRWGGLNYTVDKTISDQLNALKPQVRALAELNEKHGICGMYHTHSGPGVIGAPIWDLWILMNELNSCWIGINYDIGHATVEGGYGGWIDSSRLIGKYMKGVALKDFKWGRNVEGETYHDPFDKSLSTAGAWTPHWCATGHGMVNFEGFFRIIKSNNFVGPVQLHFEYPGFGGAENGDKTITISKEELMSAMRRDLNYVKGQMRQAQLI